MAIVHVPGDTIKKDPQSEEPYGFDWTEWLDELADTISTSTWAITGDDSALTADNPSVVTGSKMTQATLKGGTPGGRYKVTNSIVTLANGWKDDRSFGVYITNL